NLDALFSSSLLLFSMGRVEESLERFQKGIKQYPFGPTEAMWGGLATRLLELGRFDEAREACAHEKSPFGALQRKWIEQAAGRWAAAESIATVHMDDAEMAVNAPGAFLFELGKAQFARGALEASAASLERSEETGLAASSQSKVDWVRRWRLT